MEIYENVGATELHLIGAEKFVSEIIGLSARNVDHGLCVAKYMQLTGTNILMVSYW